MKRIYLATSLLHLLNMIAGLSLTHWGREKIHAIFQTMKMSKFITMTS